VISRDISERKLAERALLELNQSLERRVAERTAELTTSEARLRALVEHAPEAIVVFEGNTGRFLFGNEHACRLYGVPMEKLTELTPADVSPEIQADGRRSSELAREKMRRPWPEERQFSNGFIDNRMADSSRRKFDYCGCRRKGRI